MTEREDWRERELAAGEATTPEDLSALQADDALLDALGGSDPKVADSLGDHELNALLLAWRRDIDSEPMADLLDNDTAVTTVRTAAFAHRNRGGRKRRLLVPVAAAAAVLAIAFTGTGLAARDAKPGEALFGLSKVLFADHARSMEAAAAARLNLETAKLALAQGKFEEARRALDAAQHSMRGVAPEDDLSQLMAQHRQLSAMLSEPAGVNPPGVPNQPGVPPALPGGGNSSAPPTGVPSHDPRTQLPESTTNPPPETTTTAPPTSSSSPAGGLPGDTTSGGPRSDTPVPPSP